MQTYISFFSLRIDSANTASGAATVFMFFCDVIMHIILIFKLPSFVNSTVFVSAGHGCKFEYWPLFANDILWLDIQVYKLLLSSISYRGILVHQGGVLIIIWR